MSRINNIFRSLCCFLYFIISGKAQGKPAKFEKILIVQIAKLGDMVCTTPVFKAIKDKNPMAKIYVLGNTTNENLLKHNKDIDYYIKYKDNIFQIIREIRKENINVAFVCGPSIWSLTVLYLSHIKSIWVPKVSGGFCPYETKTYKITRWLVNTYDYPMSSYVPSIYLKTLENIGIYSQDTTKKLCFSTKAKEFAEIFFKKNNLDIQRDLIIGIAPSAGNKIRLWKAQNFVEIINYLRNKYKAKIILLGSDADKEQINLLLNILHDTTNIVNTTSLFDIDQLKAIMNMLHAFIGVETGLTFIAEAFNIPLIDIVGPVDERENSPKGPLNIIVKTNRDRPALHVLNSRVFDIIEAQRQINEISVEHVIIAFDTLINRIRKTSL